MSNIKQNKSAKAKEGKPVRKIKVKTQKWERKVGRPAIKLNNKKVDEYFELNLSVREIGKLFGVDEATIRHKYSAKIKKRKNEKMIELAEMKKKIKEKMFDVAMDGDKTLLIWLDKTLNGATEKFENKATLTIKRETIK